MSIILTLVGTITAGSVMMGSSMIGSAQKVSTTNKLDAIENALMGFRTGNNRLPCPADPTIIDSAANAATYGIEAGTPGTCTAANITSYTIPSTSATPNPSLGMTVTEGALPVRTLGLPDEFQYDGWGRKFTYAVTAIMTAQASATQSAAFISYGVQANCGAITVENAGHGKRTQVADYVLMSYGPDGHGGYTKSGTRTNAGVSNVDEIANAHYNNAGADTGLYAASYIQKDYDTYAGDSDASHPFGHVLRYKERWQMQNAYDTYHPGSQMPCTNGFVAQAPASSGGQAGSAMAVGDVNGDGIPDLIIGAAYAGVNAAVYVVFGTRTGFPDPLPLATALNGSNGFVLSSSWPPAWEPGNALATGDVNGDGIADIIIGAGLGASTGGNAYVVFGGKTGANNGTDTLWTSCPCTLATGSGHLIDGTQGVLFNGVTNLDYAGVSVAAGDVNGDGYADVIIGALGASGGANDGYTYVVFGKSGAWSSSSITLNAGYGTQIDGIQGFRLDGVTSGDQAGASVATGDISGDGIPNLIIGAGGASYSAPSAGSTYVLSGKKTSVNTFLPTTTVSTTNASKAITPASYTGLMVGETLTSAHIPASTTIHDCNGGTTTVGTICTGTINISVNATLTHSGDALTVATAPLAIGPGTLVNGTTGIRFDGQSASDHSGNPVATGDVNGDGIADLSIGAYGTYYGTWGGGSTYVIFGKRTGWSAPAGNIVLNTGYGNLIDGIQGVRFDGVAAWAGSDGAAIGDVNGDGYVDVAINSSGDAYVVFGANPILPTTTVTSNNGSSTSLSLNSYTGIMAGETLSANGIPANTTISSCTGGTVCTGTLTLSQVANVSSGTTVTVATTLLNTGTGTYIDGIKGARFDGASGRGATTAGDINGDGIPDLIIGAPGAPGGANDGYVYIYNGRKSGWPTSPFNLGGL